VSEQNLPPVTPPASAQVTPPAPAQAAPPPVKAPEPNKIQQRINQLYGQKKEAEEASALLQAENNALRSQNLDLQEQINTGLGGQLPLPPKVDQVPAPKEPGIPAVDIQKIVQDAVGNALGARDQAQNNALALKQQHVTSWGKAIGSIPELKDTNTDLYKTAQNIWDRDQNLRSDPEGPFKAAIMARGIIGTDAVSQGALNAAQQAGGVSAGNLNVQGPKAALEDAQKRLDEARGELSAGGLTAKWYPKYQQARMDIANLTKPKNE